MNKQIYEAKTKEEAITKAIEELNTTEDNVIYKVLEEKNTLLKKIAKIEVNHLGTEASAVTEVVKCGAALRKDTPKRLELTFDKPFIYFIEDTTVNDFIFIGRINKM